MPKLAHTENRLLDGAVVLSQRSRSSAWQARFKVGDKWVRATTKQKDKKAAAEVAKELYLEAQFKEKHNLPVITRRFSDIAKLAISSMKAAIEGGQGKSVYNDYIIAINRYLIPFFGKHHIHRIDYALLRQFEVWREEKMGKKPKASSIGTHNSALNKVFEEALRRGFINETQRPQFYNKGEGSDRRPDFTLDEYRQVARNLREFIKASRDGKTRQMRELLRDYVLILVNSGIRHGTEAQNLCWKHIRIEKDKRTQQNMLLFYVKGKTNGRELVARHNCLTYLKRIHSRTEAIKDLSFSELLKSKSDLPVFVLADGTKTENLRATFRKFLTEYNLLKDPRTNQNRTLYSLRHSYATFMLTLNKGTDIHLLAKQMGTSTQMIERHYSHLIARMRSVDLAGKEHGVYEGIV